MIFTTFYFGVLCATEDPDSTLKRKKDLIEIFSDLTLKFKSPTYVDVLIR